MCDNKQTSNPFVVSYASRFDLIRHHELGPPKDRATGDSTDLAGTIRIGVDEQLESVTDDDPPGQMP